MMKSSNFDGLSSIHSRPSSIFNSKSFILHPPSSNLLDPTSILHLLLFFLVWSVWIPSEGTMREQKCEVDHPTTNFSATSRRARKLKFCTDIHFTNLIQLTNCHCDICPGNICLGNICPYQEYLSSY